MESRRFILVGIICALAFLLWSEWQRDYGHSDATVQKEHAALPVQDDRQFDSAANDSVPSVKDTPVDRLRIEKSPAKAGHPAGEQQELSQKFPKVEVKTDVFDLIISTQGADIISAKLNKYPISSKTPDIPFELLKNSSSEQFVSQSGIVSKQPAPDHHVVYKSVRESYTMGDEALVVPFVWEKEGIRITKVYTFKPGSYLIQVNYRIENNSNKDWRGNVYRQLLRSKGERESRLIYTYTGGVIYSEEEKYEKISFDDMAEHDLDREIKGGWMAMIQHYFLAAWIPDPEQTNRFYSRALSDDRYVLGMLAPTISIKPGQSKQFDNQLYVGPKDQDTLSKIADNLDLTVDYGYVSVLAKPLFWLMQKIDHYLGNWGWTIVVTTLLIKLLFYKLSATSYRSMANMRKLTPRIQAIRERYGEDRQRMSQAMMDLYKKEKVNPMGGCLPVLIQIPVFISLYWVLLESVEFRQAPFILWIQDLSIKDPYYILPLIMGASMFIQQRLNPAPPDPVQAKVLMALPFIFTLFFAFFPAGLVLYWVVNNILSIAQQWMITRQIERAG
ncbi:MAG: membrane protein insertase YidC [Gammaproteobacteria bacterium]|nr:MAG: membrane protein insertase YidC [Gammaproteobacteria bacterium]